MLHSILGYEFAPLAAGAILGLGLGVLAFGYLEPAYWLLVWPVLYLGLSWVGFQVAPKFKEDTPLAEQPRAVQDGPLTMINLPGGVFFMGSPDSDDMARANEKPQHRVRVNSFRMATTPVTVALYNKIMDKPAPSANKARHPVVNVSWYDAIAFCNTLSKREGYQPCYRKRFGRWRCDWQADGYRLPTEAEWEYACRAGAGRASAGRAETQSRYSFGDDPAQLDDYAWYAGNSKSVQVVARKRPNRWGLYDMHGNVWEWCWDRYRGYSLAAEIQILPDRFRYFTYTKTLLNTRVLRGGSFVDSPVLLLSAYRVIDLPESRNVFLGFRCVRVPPQH